MTRHPAVDAPVFKFGGAGAFHAELKDKVEAYFARLGRSPRGGARIAVKAVLILAWFAASWTLLVFAATTWWQGVLLAFSLALAMAAIGFNIQHDGNHGSFSESARVNRLAGLALDALGGSSYVWRYQHNILHHSYTNLVGADHDIDTAGIGRLSPAQPRRWFHRFQAFYFWPLYSTIGVKWQFVDDFVHVVKGRIGPQPIERPKGLDLVAFVAGKLFVAAVLFVVPLLRHPLPVVLAFYLLTALTTGFVLAVVFQLAHSVEEAAHPGVTTSTRLPNEWAAHQVETTVDFAHGNRLLTWFVGGLNYQIEHHLFPRVSHVHYPALAPIVAETSARHGVRYTAHRTLRGALASHYRFLRALGRPEPSASGA